MNARVLVLVVVVLVGAGALLYVMRPAPPAEPPSSIPTLRLVQGGVGAFDSAGQRYAPLEMGSEVRVDVPLSTGSNEAMLRLSSGGTIGLAPATAFTVLPPRAGGVLRLRVDSGRVWLHLKGEERLQVSSFRSLVTVGRGDCEVRVYKDPDNYLNTVASMWAGTGTMRGGDKLRVERPLAPGLTAHVDDARVHPVARFDTSRPDEWQKRMLDLP